MRIRAALVIAATALSTVSLAASTRTTVGAAVDGFEIEVIASGLSRPTSLEFASDGRIYVAEQGGLIKVFDDIDDSTASTVVDLSTEVHAADGRGLLAIELDPAFPTRPYLFALYAYDAPIGGTAPTFGTIGAYDEDCPSPPGPGRCVVSGRLVRFELANDQVVARTTLIEDWCQEWTSHSIASLAFGADGSLFVSAGDGGFAGQPDYGQRSGRNGCGDPPVAVGALQTLPNAEGGAVRSQDYRTSGDPLGLNGTVIRIDPDTGAGWPTNPDITSTDPNVRRLVAHGLRNPYRIEVMPGTSDLWIGDVGWNTYEELNVLPDTTSEVVNFGWPCFEGTARAYDLGLTVCEDLYAEGPSSVQQPYWAYQQKTAIVPGDGCFNNNGSISALAFYEGGRYPNAYDGALFFGDYSRRCMWVMQAGPDGRPDPTTVESLFTGLSISDLDVGPGGDIYMVNIFGANGVGGQILHLAYPEGALEPTARLTAAPQTGPAPLTTVLDASSSTPGEAGLALTFDWDLDADTEFDDGTGPTITPVFADEGIFSVRVRVTDSAGRSDTASLDLQVGTPPEVTIDLPTGAEEWAVDDVIAYAGSATDGNGPVPADRLVWTFDLNHCETLQDCHTHRLATVGGSADGTVLGPDHEYPSFLTITLEAVGSSGLTGRAVLDVFPRTTTVTVASNPAGIRTTLNGVGSVDPIVAEVIEGSMNTVGASAIGGSALDGILVFDGWSDGGIIQHDFVAPADQIELIASYEPATGSASAGEAHTMAIKGDGTLWGWGSNVSGRLGDGTTIRRVSPVQIGSASDWVMVSAGAEHTMAIKGDGTLWGWGSNVSGRLGDGTTIRRVSPVQIGSASDWVMVSAGAEHTMAIKGDGTLWGWGSNVSGRLGDGTTIRRVSPVQIGTASDWSDVDAGTQHTLGLTSDGHLFAWGSNGSGRLGDGSTALRRSPVAIEPGMTWIDVSAGGSHSMAVASDGSMWAWGENSNGQTGDGTRTDRLRPVRSDFHSVSGVSVSAGSAHSVVLASTSAVWVWGANTDGRVGDGSTVRRVLPLEVLPI